MSNQKNQTNNPISDNLWRAKVKATHARKRLERELKKKLPKGMEINQDFLEKSKEIIK